MVTRAATVRTRSHKLILRPSGRSELYAYREDPNERQNLCGNAAAAMVQHELEYCLAVWYVNTTGVARFDKDQRNAPPFYPTHKFRKEDWHRQIIDET